MPQNPTDPNWGTPNPTDPNWGQQAAPPNPSATGWRHAADTAISDITSLPRLALSAIQDPGGTASHLGQSAVDLYQKANDFVADPVTSAKQGLSAIKADPWAAAGHAGALVAQGGAMAGLKRLSGTLSPIEAAMPAEAAAATRPVRGLLGSGATPLPHTSDFDTSFARGVPAQFAEHEPVAAAPVAEPPSAPQWVHQPEDKRALFAAAQKAADDARGQPAAPMAATIPTKSPQQLLNEEALAGRQAKYRQGLQAIPPETPKNPAEALAASLGTPSDQLMNADMNSRYARGKLKTPSADLARQMKGAPGVSTPETASQTAQGAIAPHVYDEPAAPEVSGPVATGQPEARPRRAPLERTTNGNILDDLVSEAQKNGHAGDPAALRRELEDRMNVIAEGDAAFDADSGHSPDALLKTIAKYGGLSEQADTTYPGEMKWLKEFRDQKASASRTNLLAPPVAADTVRGVKGVFRNAGLSLDDMLSSLKQDSKFNHIETVNDLIDELASAATSPKDSRLMAERLRQSLGQKWWERIGGDITFDPTEFEGELQGRLPGAEHVRNQEIATPQYEAPFSLSGGVDTTPKERPMGLFDKAKGQEGSVPVGALLQTLGVPGRILAYPAAYHYAGTPGLATLGAADLAKLVIEHPEMAGKAGRASLLANMAVTPDRAGR